MHRPAVLCIDAEPDAREIPVPATADAWLGFTQFLGAAPGIRDRLAAASGRAATFGWFLRLDPQIEVGHGTATWVLEHFGSDLSDLVDAGDELGVHAHCWRWHGDHWCADHGDAGWVDHALTTALDSYESAFGRPPPAYRGGDRYFDRSVFTRLRERGVGVDLTLEPGAPALPGLAGGCATGVIPAVPPDRRRAYHPAIDDPLTPGSDARLLAIPLTTMVSFRRGDPGATTPRATLGLAEPPGIFRVGLDAALADEGADHLAFALRTDVVRAPVLWRWTLQNLMSIADVLGDEVEWCTPTRAAEILSTGGTSPGIDPSPDTTVAAGARFEAALFDADVALLAAADAHEATRVEAQRLAARIAVLDARNADLTAQLAEMAAQRDAMARTRWWRLRAAVASMVRRLGRRRFSGTRE